MLYFIYRFICSNVGLAIMIFTLIVKLAMLPLSIKQQKASAKTAVFQPKVLEIQKKYKNNTQKQQEELMKLQQMGYKPMSGCGTMLLSFLILFGVIDVVYKPLTHIVHMSGESIVEITEDSYNVEAASFFAQALSYTDEEISAMDEAGAERVKNIRTDAKLIVDYYNEHKLKDGAEPYDISVLAELSIESASVIKQTFKDAIAQAYAGDTSDKKKQKSLVDTDLYKLTDAENEELSGITSEEGKAAYTAEHSFSKPTIDMLNNCQIHYGNYVCSSEVSTFAATGAMQRELYVLERFGSKVGGIKCSDAFTRPSAEMKEELSELYNNLNFIGIPLGQVPKDHMEFPMILIPIISFVMSMLQTFISQRLMTQSNPDAAKSMGPMKIMLFIMPLMSLWIAFTVPAGAGFYWAVSYLYGVIQTVVLNKIYNPAKLREQAEVELKAMTKKSGKVVNVEPVKVVKEDGTEETVSQKELYRRKLAAARKADAEKYGEEYHEDDDE